MKAIIVDQFGGSKVLQMKETKIPIIGPNDVLIKVAKTSVNFTDVKKRKGNKGTGSFPFAPGLDVAGTIKRVGESIK